ncbi:hypothetical protein SLS62_001157 [Diatrype stigma]|uniref:Manganese/iron superoxide dismutase C-terminal domain-containing protein n=1 Tax=Diatrype stigma TaxID=117547 RepID=A0AAN9UZE0_9PEZI
MIRPRLRIPRAGSLLRRRPAIQAPLQFHPYHTVPVLQQFRNVEEGVPGLLSPEGFQMAWTEYIEFVLNKLNNLTAQTEFEEKEVHQIVKETARQPSQAPTFNYASMAYNHNFFFENLARLQPAEEGRPVEEVGLLPVAMPAKIKNDIELKFGSVETLRREMIATADAMFGPGYVWLVKPVRSSAFRILPTYLAGTPFTAGHWRRQGLDMNVHGFGAAPQGYSVDDSALQYVNRQQVGAGNSDVGRFDNRANAPGATEVIPLLCVSTWQHVYLRDWGVAGKRQYLEAWWDCIDWNKVDSLSHQNVSFK